MTTHALQMLTTQPNKETHCKYSQHNQRNAVQCVSLFVCVVSICSTCCQIDEAWFAGAFSICTCFLKLQRVELSRPLYEWDNWDILWFCGFNGHMQAIVSPQVYMKCAIWDRAWLSLWVSHWIMTCSICLRMWIYSVTKQCCVLLGKTQQFCCGFVRNYFHWQNLAKTDNTDNIVSKM